MQKNEEWRNPVNSTRNYYGGGRTAPWRGDVRMATPQEVYRKILLPPRSLSGVFEFRRFSPVHEGADAIAPVPHSVIFYT